ncbi:hypothetical protein H0H81_005121 [Sphagnurus paluster]|uniref:HMG box domain-containing protein n=1 Tax=Sphagnurus paluster TaxID=117069 RepID=A0A9P7GP76_9AGAR|nr:hypothetical protein H0H81_005121 [Sphagnurus paluster]
MLHLQSPQGQFIHFHSTGTEYALNNHPLIEPDLCHSEFETPTFYQYPESPPSPLHDDTAAAGPSTRASKKAPKGPPRLRSGNRVPRPRNAFMIFRSEFWADSKISKSVERDHRHISRIIGHCWNQLPDHEKDVWRRKAEQEKIEHAQRYPGYRFSPNTRTKQVVRRNVKRNGEDELLRCKQVAELLLAGKAGVELDHAVKSIDTSLGRDMSPPAPPKKVLENSSKQQDDAQAFRSPLVPPPEPLPATHQYAPRSSSPPNATVEYPVDNNSSQYQQSWSLQYSAPHEDTTYTSQYIPQAQPTSAAAAWPTQAQEYDTFAYPAAEVYQPTQPVNTNSYTAYPRSSPFHIEFVNPFEYPPPAPALSSSVAHTYTHAHVVQQPLDPLHWELSGHVG